MKIREDDKNDFLCAAAVVFGIVLGLWLGCKVLDRLSADSPLLRIPVGRVAQRECPARGKAQPV